MFKLFCIFVILNFLIYSSRKTLYIPGVTINSANNEKYYGLPNEVPALSSIFEKLKTENSSKYEIIQSLSNIIGLFPLSEQYALYQSVMVYINGNDLFDLNTYNTYMINQGYFNKQIDSLNEYLTEEENRKILSLGAIKKVMAQFGYNSFEDENITMKIEENINEILNAQKRLDECENSFLNVLFPIFLQRRYFLFDIKMSNYNINDGNEKFVRDENKNYTIKGFYYNQTQSNDIINSFKDFAICHHYYNNILNYNAILTQIYIGQLDKCSNVEETNEFSGNSSNKVNYTEEFKGDNKIGTNVYDNVRADSKTLNNYLLNNGFRLGKEYKKIDKSDKAYRFNISYEWIKKIENIKDIVEKTDIFDDEFEELFDFLNITDDDNLNKDYRPFVNLARLFLQETKFINESSKINFDKNILQFYEQNKTFNSNKWNNKYIFIDNKSDIIDNLNIFIKEDKENKDRFKDNKYFNSYKIFIYIINSNEKLMIVEASDKDDNKYFDLYLNGESYATTFYNTITACFAAFSSLGKDDKDACRGVLTKKCGRELDYRCKESGFYDVILQNPVADNILPQSCLEINNDKYNDSICLKWLEVYLFKNGLIIKPSAMGSFSLLMQSSSKGYDSINTRLMSVFGDNEYPISTYQPTPSKDVKPKLKTFNIQNISSSGDFINNLMSQVDKTFYLQMDHSNNIKFSYIFLLLILFLFN